MSVKLPQLTRPRDISYNSRSVSPKEMLNFKKINPTYLDRDTPALQFTSLDTARPRPSPESCQPAPPKVFSLPNIKRKYGLSPEPIFRSFVKLERPNQ